MRVLSIRLLSVFLLILIAPSLLAGKLPELAQAQSPTLSANEGGTKPFSLTISPTVVEMAIQPGKVVTQAFLIENNGTVDLEVRPVLRDFEADGSSGVPQLLPGSTFPYAQLVNSSIQLNQSFSLPAGESEQLVLEVRPSELAEQRDWYTTLLLETKPDPRSTLVENSGAAATGFIGAHILVRITQTNQIPLHWDVRFELPRFVDSLQKLEFAALVSNQSTTMSAPDMTVTIIKGDTEIISEQTALPERILAQSSRRIFAQQARKDDPRSFEGTPFRFDPAFAFGKYTVRASIRNNSGGPLVREHEFWAFPFSLGIAVLAALLILLGLFLWRQRKNLPLPQENES